MTPAPAPTFLIAGRPVSLRSFTSVAACSPRVLVRAASRACPVYCSDGSLGTLRWWPVAPADRIAPTVRPGRRHRDNCWAVVRVEGRHRRLPPSSVLSVYLPQEVLE